jgi:hypothetical protein
MIAAEQIIDYLGSDQLTSVFVAFGVSGLCWPEDSAWRRKGNGTLSPLPDPGLFLPAEDDLSARGVQCAL